MLKKLLKDHAIAWTKLGVWSMDTGAPFEQHVELTKTAQAAHDRILDYVAQVESKPALSPPSFIPNCS
jgi:hypothetical protein